MFKSLRLEALYFLKRGMPEWMHIDDLIHAGWLGYQEGLRRVKPGTPDPHNYAKHWARGCMKAELMAWYGSGRSRDGFLIHSEYIGERSIFDNLADPTTEDIEEQEKIDDDMQYLWNDLLSHLTEQQHKALFFHFEYNLTPKEIAPLLNVTHGRVRVLISVALRNIRRMIVTGSPTRRRMAA